MIIRDLANVVSHRTSSLAQKLRDKAYRHSYISQHLRTFLADQIRSLRGDRSQKEFGKIIGKPQSVVSRIENESDGMLSLQTLLDIATKLDIALIVRFVDYPTFTKVTSDYSESALMPRSFDEKDMDALILKEQESALASAANGFHKDAGRYIQVMKSLLDFPTPILSQTARPFAEDKAAADLSPSSALRAQLIDTSERQVA